MPHSPCPIFLVSPHDLQHAPPPNVQNIIFDPANYVSFWPRIFDHSKTGLVGGHLGVANVGSFSPATLSASTSSAPASSSSSSSAGQGFELIAFSPILRAAAAAATTSSASTRTPPCVYSGPFTKHFVAGNTAPPLSAKTLAAAESLCDTTVDCGGITYQYDDEERAPLYNT